jgi:hypothetical protein
MTTRIKLTLIDSTAGTWTAGDGSTAATGITIPANEDYWQVADALQPHVARVYGRLTDALVECYDPAATDLAGQPSADPVCQFRIIDGVVEAQV